jgi:HSP20 family protein
MALRVWNPLDEIMSEHTWTPWMSGHRHTGARTAARRFAPPADVWETSEGYVVRLELAGVAREDIDVSVEKGVLSIKGDKKAAADGELTLHRVESGHGAFTRSFALPDQANPDKIDASYKDGVLTLGIAYRETSLPRKIDVTVN